MSDEAENGTHHAHDSGHEQRVNRVWWIFAGLALFYLLSEHRAHLFGILPYLLLLACPVMHLFMHKDHHRGHGSDEQPNSRKDGR